MRNKTLKITLESLLEVLLNHGISLQKIESIMADLGVSSPYIERALANIMVIFPRKHEQGEGATERQKSLAGDVATQLKEMREMIEKIYSKLSITSEDTR
ncbi:MAG: hypothetical protein N3F04_03965 [Candidatus Nezhaarchaeota archaeon]|nr:hypothetical protein [Candidatus Nezhaarchaeota archaeon]